MSFLDRRKIRNKDFKERMQCQTKALIQSVRALDLFGKDHEFLKLLADPNIEINGISNKGLRPGLSQTRWGKGKTDKQLSAKISRQFRLLRDHGLLRKQPGRQRYNLTSRDHSPFALGYPCGSALVGCRNAA